MISNNITITDDDLNSISDYLTHIKVETPDYLQQAISNFKGELIGHEQMKAIVCCFLVESRTSNRIEEFCDPLWNTPFNESVKFLNSFYDEYFPHEISELEFKEINEPLYQTFKLVESTLNGMENKDG